MDLWATKDHYEREEEEADRLVRPDPKWIDELLENLQLRDKADSNMRSLSLGA